MMDEGCSCGVQTEHYRDEQGDQRTVTHLIYDPMCLVHGQVGIS